MQDRFSNFAEAMKCCSINVVTVCRISYSDFVKTFTHLEVVHLDAETSRDEPSLHSKHTWQMKLYQGSWRRGVTAGGCRNNQGSIIASLKSLRVIINTIIEITITNAESDRLTQKFNLYYLV